MPPARILLYVATAGALSRSSARSLILGPIPLAVALVRARRLRRCSSAAGWPSSASACSSTSSGAARGEARGVALTFDDGPSPEHTPRVLDLLDEAGVKATFFVIGKKADDAPRARAARSRRAATPSASTATRTTGFFALRSPRHGRRRPRREAIAALEAITGERPTLFRPPVGPHRARASPGRSSGSTSSVVGWSVRGLDGRRGRAAGAGRRARRAAPPRRRDRPAPRRRRARRLHRPASRRGAAADPRRDARHDLAGVRLDAWLGDPAS